MYNKCYIEAKNTDSRCVDEQFFLWCITIEMSDRLLFRSWLYPPVQNDGIWEAEIQMKNEITKKRVFLALQKRGNSLLMGHE